MVQAMSDDQVATELKKMTMFIRQEALEKAREIEIKADEEFAIEKSKLVRQETAGLDQQFQHKFKQASMSQQIARSTLANRTRLRVLAARQELLDELFEKTGKRLEKEGSSGGDKKYGELCKGLVLEAAFALAGEERLAVRARKKDFGAVKGALDGVVKEYKEKIGKEVKIELDEKNPLPEASYGGVVVLGAGGKIDVNNTLEERLKLLESDALPMVRTCLFGKNENRRFYD